MTTDRAGIRAARAMLLSRLGSSLDAVTDSTCRAVADYGDHRTCSSRSASSSDTLRQTVRWVADLFVRTATSGAPLPDVTLKRLEMVSSTSARRGTEFADVSKVVRAGTRSVLETLVREVNAPDGTVVTSVEALATLTSDLATFANTVLSALHLGYVDAGVDSREVGRGSVGRGLLSALPRHALESVGTRRSTSPPYQLVVGVPLSDRGATLLSDSLSQLATSIGSLVEGASFGRPLPHAAAVASKVEPWRQSELVAACAALAASQELLIVYSPVAHTTGELEPYYRIARDNLELATRAYRTDCRALPLAALAFDAMLLTIPRRQQVIFIQTLFGQGLALPPERASVLVDTVRAIVAEGGSGTGPARALSLHRHGVSYRRRRIQTLNGHDPGEAASRPAFFAALRMLDLCCDELPPLGSDQWRLD